MPRQFPTAAQVRELPTLADHTIPAEWEDQNGHVNIQHYMSLYEIGGWPLFGSIGIDENFFAERKLGIFDLEHHLFYLNELHVGERVTMHGRFLSRNKKRTHGMMFVVNDNRDLLACTLEFVSTGANLTTRRTDEFPADVAAGIDALIDADRKINWAAPLCGAMSI